MSFTKMGFRWLRMGLACLAIPAGVWDLGAAEPAPMDRSGNVVWMLEAKGRVDVLHATQRSAARPHQALVPADRLQTWTNSHANLLWYDRVHFQVSELSEIKIPPPPGAQRRTTLEVLKGFLYFFHRGEPREVEIKTPTAAAIVVGTEFSVRVEGTGRTVLLLFDGSLEVSNPQGQARVTSGQQATIDPGQPPVVTPIVEVTNDLIQWFLHYPGVLNMDEVGFTPAEEQTLAASLAAYRSGDLREAVSAYPPLRVPASDAERIYFAALLLAVGQVDKAEAQFGALAPTAERPAALAAALRNVVATVKGRTAAITLDPRLATAALAESYARQAKGELERSLDEAKRAAALAPEFGFAWARVAELEFSFGRTGRALRAVERALQLSPRNAQALALQGFLFSAQNRIGAALERFDQAILLDGGLGNAWLGRGLCRIRRGEGPAGRQDLLVAAGVEPQRSLLRSYLGKALADAGEVELARHELELARRLDPKDPTAPLYDALLKEQRNELNPAVRDLEASQALNRNRHLYRSQLLIDQDRAVRSANLANIYQDAGLTDVGVREATRAVTSDYANYSAHLFLADTYNQLRDPRLVNLRYETAAVSEYLVANLLAPVGAGVLSPAVSQHEYSKLFERDRSGWTTGTEYYSNGDWIQNAALYGLAGNTSYLLAGSYRSENGQQPNSDREQIALSLQVKQQVGPRDTILLQPGYYHAEGGDVGQYYDPAQANRGFRFEESQEPNLLAGWHHDWNPGHHTLLVAGRVQDTFTFQDPARSLLAFERTNGNIAAAGGTIAPTEYRNELVNYFAEAQQIGRAGPHTLVLGARYHSGSFDTLTRLQDSAEVIFRFNQGAVFPAATNRLESDFERAGGYAYGFLNPFEPLLITAGVAYDWVRYQGNWRFVPITAAERETEQLSPKLGLTWQPAPDTTLRAAYTRSLGGVSLDQSYRIEPTQVAGFNQAFRSLSPEAVTGNVPVPSFDTAGVAIEQRFKAGLYLGVEAQWLRSEVSQTVGVENANFSLPPPTGYTAGSTRRALEFEEQSLTFSAHQLLGDYWSLGARYRLSVAGLQTRFSEVPAAVIATATTNATLNSDQAALLQHLTLALVHNHPSGFFAQAQANWYGQDNRRDDSGLADESLWQFDVFAGWRLPWRRAELRLGVLNVTDQDYRLNPLNLLPELPRERTFTASLKFNF